jgi:hypothetical protein
MLHGLVWDRNQSYSVRGRRLTTRANFKTNLHYTTWIWSIWTEASYKKCTIYIINKTGQHCGAFMQPLLQWKSNKYYIFWVRICSLRYLACNAHAPYCYVWPPWLYSIFPHYLINGTIKKKYILLKIKCFDFLYNFWLKTSLYKKKWAR